MTDNWTPSTEQVRSHYVFDQSNRWEPERGEAFDRWLSRVRAEARVEVLAEVAENADELQHTREEVRERIYDGYSVDWSEGYDAACRDIAKWARQEIEQNSEGNET